jgi:hypothetical protein
MRLTEAEKGLVLRERERLELESRDWSKEPFVTDVQLNRMSEWVTRAVVGCPLIWRRDELAMIYRNATHPDNEAWCNMRDAAAVMESYYEG